MRKELAGLTSAPCSPVTEEVNFVSDKAKITIPDLRQRNVVGIVGATIGHSRDHPPSPVSRHGGVQFSVQSDRLSAGGARKLLKRMAPQVGFEPTTLRLTAGCSAIELLRNVSGGAKPNLNSNESTAAGANDVRVGGDRTLLGSSEFC